MSEPFTSQLSAPPDGSRWRIIRLLAALAAVALLQACSAIKLAYNNVPELGYWWIDGYADLNTEQSALTRDALGRALGWHRTQELPQINTLLQQAQGLVGGDVSGETVCRLFADARLRLNAVGTQLEPAAVALAMRLAPEQLAHMEGKFAKINAEWRDKWLSGTPAERLETRLAASLERSEPFYGKLDERQTTLLRARLARSLFEPQLNFDERLRRQQDLMQLLRRASGQSAAEVATALRGYLERVAVSPNPGYRAYSERLVRDNCDTFAELHNTTTPAQRERATRQIGVYLRQFNELQSGR